MPEARRYQQLAELAREAGYRVTPAQIHHWVRAGLLPATAERRSVGRRGFRSEPRTGAERQLIALCGLRSITTSRGSLALLLWLDGWEVPLGRVRAALVEAVPAPLSHGLNDNDRDRISALAMEHARSLRRQLPPAKLSQMDVAEVGEFLMRFVVGDQPDPSAELEATLSRAMGLDRAASDTIGSAEPWYDPSSAGVLSLLAGFTLDELHELIESVADDELSLARDPARTLIYDMPRIAEAIELAYGRGVAGFGPLRLMSPAEPHLGVIATLRASRAGLGPSLAALVESCRSPQLQQVLESLPEARAFVRAHPQRRRIEQDGLVAHSAADGGS
jgi:hypothetical protein